MNLRTILTAAAILLSIASVFFLIKAIGKRDYGKVSQSLITLLATVITVYFALPNGISSIPTPSSVGNPSLEITDQIETGNLGSVYFRYITVLNRGTATASNCVIEIEYRASEGELYKFLGYAYYLDFANNEVVNLVPQTQSEFMLVRSMPTDGAKPLNTCITLKEIRDYVDKENNSLNPYYVTAGDYYLRLTAVSINCKSPPREFKLHVTQDEPAILEVIPY